MAHLIPESLTLAAGLVIAATSAGFWTLVAIASALVAALGAALAYRAGRRRGLAQLYLRPPDPFPGSTPSDLEQMADDMDLRRLFYKPGRTAQPRQVGPILRKAAKQMRLVSLRLDLLDPRILDHVGLLARDETIDLPRPTL